MGKGDFKITANGIKLILTILVISSVLFGFHKGYIIYSETVKLNSLTIKKIEPVVDKNEKDIIRFDSRLGAIDKRQERIEKKIDIVLERIPR